MQVAKTTPAYSRRPFTLSTLAGVCDVRATGETIMGRWCNELHWLMPRGDSSPAADFTNYNPRPESVAKFTRLYGPLLIEPSPGKQFQFPLSDWLAAQDGFRFLWDVLASGIRRGSWGRVGAHDDFETVIAFGERGELRFLSGRGDGLVFADRKLTYRTGTMLRFLVLDLLSRDPKRLRKCKRPNCQHPYFVAHHLNQRFCSDLCAAWGQSEWKRQWWGKKGKKWRAARHRSDSRR